MRHKTKNTSAFTLVELILVMALTVILTALLLPSLRTTRTRAQSVVSQSNIRSHATVMLAYAGDWREYYPYITDRSREITVLSAAGQEWELRYFDPVNYWPIGLLDAYYDGQAGSPAFHPPSSRRVGHPISSYWYSSTMITAPSYWNRFTRLEGTSQWTPIAVSDVRFPSYKGLLIEGYERFNEAVTGGSHNVAMCDNSVWSPKQDELTPGYPGGNGGRDTFPGGSGGLTIGAPVLHTPEGVYGTDILQR
ncbi:MAG: hypothetical protein Kow0022_18560 [Phycisphaerales bacterium]